MADFFQDPPVLGNQYDEDRALRSYLARRFPPDVLVEVEPDLRRFGGRVVGDVLELAADANANEPRLVQFDPWGRRIDRIETSRGWRELDRVSAQEGLVAIGYERKYGPLSRLYQFAKLYLFNASSATYSCPLAMTDGAARLLEVMGDAELKQHALSRLTSRDPQRFWTSGQWMTERTGGSDVGRTQTVARHESGPWYRLYGTKWFTSATTAQMSMTLARIEDTAGASTAGSRGLSLFYLETRDAAGDLNNIVIHRLKDKLGTRSLPTAELSMVGTRAKLVGAPGDGVRNITTLVNVTRLYNAIGAAATLRRCIALARDYASRREAFGRKLIDLPLHAATLADLEIEFQAGLQLALRAVELLGREECGAASADESAVLRLLTPLAKLYTARQAVAAASETVESFGGAGYVEDTGLPQVLRDAQVLSIWEGTTNVLSLDALRAIEKSDAFGPFMAEIDELVAGATLADLAPAAEQAREAAARVRAYLPAALGEGPEFQQAGARGFAFGLSRLMAAALLLDEAQWNYQAHGDCRGVAVAQRWCTKELTPLVQADRDWRRQTDALARNTEMKEATAAHK
ncbi:MAG: acyl-CoA dehydrogenase family protein [Planctomycetia bacterium]|nr:acyl-CoA dehydrogenase family protein [Planctomycetia bacterium]